MSWSRDSTPKGSGSFRRTSLPSFRDESRAERSTASLNRSATESRTPVQQRLQRLQSQLREEQLKKGLVPEDINRTSVMQRLRSNLPQSQLPLEPREISSRDHSPATSTTTPMVMSPPKRHHLKRRSDQNHNDVEMQSVTKKTRLDKSPSPSVQRRFAAARSRSSSSSRMAAASPPKYDNDIEMTDASIQEEISSLRESSTIREDYSLTMTINAENRLVIKFKDFADEKTSGIQKRLLSRQIDTETLHIVVDTNVFIKDLSLFPSIMERQFPDKLGYPVLVIPYIVLKELENLAHTNRGRPIETSAKMANKFINQQFTAKNPQLKGQKLADHNVKLLAVESGDDDVLNCCLQVKQSGKKVILLSNDVNLRNKALFSEIPAFSSEAIMRRDLKIEFNEL